MSLYENEGYRDGTGSGLSICRARGGRIMRWQRLAVALIPLTAGLVIASLMLDVDAVPNPVLQLRVDVGSVVLVAGIMVSLVVGAGLTMWEWQANTCHKRMVAARTTVGKERRRFLRRLDHELKKYW